LVDVNHTVGGGSAATSFSDWGDEDKDEDEVVQTVVGVAGGSGGALLLLNRPVWLAVLIVALFAPFSYAKYSNTNSSLLSSVFLLWKQVENVCFGLFVAVILVSFYH